MPVRGPEFAIHPHLKEAHKGRGYSPCSSLPFRSDLRAEALFRLRGKNGELVITAKRERQPWEKPEATVVPKTTWTTDYDLYQSDRSHSHPVF